MEPAESFSSHNLKNVRSEQKPFKEVHFQVIPEQQQHA